MYRPLLMLKKAGYSGHFFAKHAMSKNWLSKSSGSWWGISDTNIPWPVDTNFIGAFRAETDVQNVGVDGEICNLMPLGSGVATSIHSAPIFAPDVDGVYREYAIDEAVWKGARWDAGVAYSTDIDGIPLKPTPFLCADGFTAVDGLTPIHTDYTFPAANIDPVEDTKITFRYENTGADGEIFDIGKNIVLGMLSDTLQLTDGVNTITLPLAKGTHDIEIIVSGHEMAIKAGTAYAVGAYTSVPAGVITVSRNIWALHTLPAIDLERVLNGDFEDADTGWTGLDVVGGVARTISTTGYQVIATTAGIDYNLNFTCDAKGVSPQLQVQNGNTTGSPPIAEVNPSGNIGMQSYNTTFTALGPDSIIVLSNGSNTALWDNISIKAVS